MPDDFLGSIEFSEESGDRTPEEFIDLTHDPDILYYYILDSKEKLNSGIEIDADVIQHERVYSSRKTALTKIFLTQTQGKTRHR